MRDKSWAVVRDWGPLGASIVSTHRSRFAAQIFRVLTEAANPGLCAVHSTEHAKEVVRCANAEWVSVFTKDGGVRYINAMEE